MHACNLCFEEGEGVKKGSERLLEAVKGKGKNINDNNNDTHNHHS